MGSNQGILCYSYYFTFSGSLCFRAGAAMGTGGQEGKQAGPDVQCTAVLPNRQMLSVRPVRGPLWAECATHTRLSNSSLGCVQTLAARRDVGPWCKLWPSLAPGWWQWWGVYKPGLVTCGALYASRQGSSRALLSMCTHNPVYERSCPASFPWRQQRNLHYFRGHLA